MNNTTNKVTAEKDIIESLKLHKEKSIRVNFRLSEQGIKDLKMVKKEFNINNNALFDSIESFLKNPKLIEILKEWLENVKDRKFTVRRTFVISKKSLDNINELSKKIGIKRDVLLEDFVDFYAKILKMDREKQKEKYKIALEMISKLLEEAESIEKKWKEMFDKDEILLRRIGFIIAVIDDSTGALIGNLEKDEPITDELFKSQ